MAVRWEIQTASGAPGAIAAAQVSAANAAELEGALRALEIEPVGAGRAGVRDLMGVDTGVVARWTPTSACLMPHGGPRVVRRLAAAIGERLGPPVGVSARERFPEAGSLLEARVLDAVARASSPLALPLLLDQVRRWPAESHDEDEPATPPGGEGPSVLRWLLEPALVVAVGAPNIGKSALVNALAGRPVSIVADEPGTTRDHVGVLLDCTGLVIRYVDTPGLRDDARPVEEEAGAIAREMVRRADLVLACGDAGSAPPESAAPALRVGLRSDLGCAGWGPQISVSAFTGDGLPALVAGIRERLVPESALRDPRPWRFWGAAG